MQGSTPDRALLELRARRLAAPLRGTAGATDRVFLEFTLHSERCALEAQLVCGTFRFTDFTPLPGAGAEVVGVTLWRGAVLRILDLASVLGGSRAGLDDRAMVIAVGEIAPRFGLLVSSLASVAPIVLGEDLARIASRERRFVRHVTADAVQVLDGRALLSTFG
ncbi:MAG TPA: chemotaxis protein CheW [Gemmatimonadaceae bacterium]|nr:chemotaxis protein CheW [Gemmatimonadaceae bacterium]